MLLASQRRQIDRRRWRGFETRELEESAIEIPILCFLFCKSQFLEENHHVKIKIDSDTGFGIDVGNHIWGREYGVGHPNKSRIRPIRNGLRVVCGPHGRVGGVIGIVDLEGAPIGPGNTDTIVERLAGIDHGR